MTIDEIITNALVGKRLVLYKLEWIDSTSKKNVDIKKIIYQVSPTVGEYHIDYRPRGPFHKGTKWNKLQLNSMVVEKLDFLINSVGLVEGEDYHDNATINFDLEGFGWTYQCNMYEDLTII